MIRYLRLLILCLFCTSQCLGQDNIGCFVTGECLNGFTVGISKTNGSMECLGNCQGTPSCIYFTYYRDDEFCLKFETCPEFSTNTCSDCISGDSTCNGYQCSIAGFCEGNLVTALDISSKDVCIQACKENSQCNWWTYNGAENICTLLSNCAIIDESCTNCVSGEKECQSGITDTSLIFAIGGSTGGLPTFGTETRITQSVRLDSPTGNSCSSTALFPYAIQLAVSAVVSGAPVVCGGYSSVILGTCSMYDSMTDTWGAFPSLLTGREGGASAQLDGDRFWVTGGKGATSETILYSTEIYSSSEDKFISGPNLPYATSRHCLASINDTHVLLTGGSLTDIPNDATAKVYIIEPDTDTVLELSAMSRARYGHGCGIIQSLQNGPELVVAGGFGADNVMLDDAEILNISAGIWRSGPGLPVGPRSGMSSVPFEDSFLLVGGLNTLEEALDEIFEFDQVSETWISRPERLGSGRSNLAAVLLGQDSGIECP